MDNVFFIVLLLLMMEVLSSSSRYTTASFRHRHKKRTQALCVGGKWFQVGSFRFWQRSTCAKRRQAPMLPPGVKPVTDAGDLVMPKLGNDRQAATNRPSTLDFELLMPSAEDGPVRNETYDPNYGHEPYWAHGDWVFDQSPYKKNVITHMCEIRCPQVYVEFGKICGRDLNFNYETFDNFCQLKNKDCLGVYRWMPLYKGQCYRDFKEFPRLNLHKKTIEIIKKVLTALPKHEKYVGYCGNCTNPDH